MSQPLLGMDVAGVRTLAALLRQRAADLRDAAALLGTLVHSVQWVGPDAEAFRSQWDGVERHRMLAVANGLEDAARRALLNAQEQELTSAR